MKGKTKVERQQARKLERRKEAKRKAKVHKNQILAYRRQMGQDFAFGRLRR